MFTAYACRLSSRLPSAARILSQHSRAVKFSGTTTTTAGVDPVAPDSTGSDDPPPPDVTSTTSSQSTRIRALSLYRQLLRGAERMPTPNRQNYIKRKTKDEYRKHMTLTDEEDIVFQLRLADTNLDTVLVQAEHLSR